MCNNFAVKGKVDEEVSQLRSLGVQREAQVHKMNVGIAPLKLRARCGAGPDIACCIMFMSRPDSHLAPYNNYKANYTK
ncbi:unnamed protein product [Arctia plantaginis]|uniref:Uncharacterized protein n=1 Tax=Arctia plantaginis TaxID=874455 RepID=A0A8S1BKE3_ARCPL|nr:unnamed protein product [Arctia plantaginis]